MIKLRTPQYWLAELDQYGNPELIDGSHETPQACNKAAYLIKALHLGKADRQFAVAKVELSECVPSAEGVNHATIDLLNSHRPKIVTE